MSRWWLIVGVGFVLSQAATAAEQPSATNATHKRPVLAQTHVLSSGYLGYCPPTDAASQQDKEKSQKLTISPTILKAAYAPNRERTFFLYRGYSGNSQQPVLMVSFYDHQLQKLARPRPIHPSCQITPDTSADFILDKGEYLWVFVGSDKKQQARVYKSALPFSNAGFFPVKTTTFAHPKVIYDKKNGFLLFHSVPGNDNSTGIYLSSSHDGLQWSEPRLLVKLGEGHFYHAAAGENCVGLVFNYSPQKDQQDLRTNLYYIQSLDFGQTWQTPDGKMLKPPLRKKDNPALIRDYKSMKRVAFIKDLNFDAYDNPVILYLSALGPEFKGRRIRRTWYTARWFRDWRVSGLITSDHNRDAGSLFLEPNNSWRLIAPTSPAEQQNMPGGQVVMWMSRDAGRSWFRSTLTPETKHNHNHVIRPLDANEDCYALWSDNFCVDKAGNNLYLCTQQGRVFKLPNKMEKPFVYPELYKQEKE